LSHFVEPLNQPVQGVALHDNSWKIPAWQVHDREVDRQTEQLNYVFSFAGSLF
jgi:hypothetical protein